MLDKLAREQGFENEQEMHTMIASVDLTHDATRRAFLGWKEYDGSKEGLEKILKLKEGGDDGETE